MTVRRFHDLGRFSDDDKDVWRKPSEPKSKPKPKPETEKKVLPKSFAERRIAIKVEILKYVNTHLHEEMKNKIEKHFMSEFTEVVDLITDWVKEEGGSLIRELDEGKSFKKSVKQKQPKTSEAKGFMEELEEL
jgi:hypothetical protein